MKKEKIVYTVCQLVLAANFVTCIKRTILLIVQHFFLFWQKGVRTCMKSDQTLIKVTMGGRKNSTTSL